MKHIASLFLLLILGLTLAACSHTATSLPAVAPSEEDAAQNMQNDLEEVDTAPSSEEAVDTAIDSIDSSLEETDESDFQQSDLNEEQLGY